MLYPKFARKSDLMLGLVAALVVLVSGIAMRNSSAPNPNFVDLMLPNFGVAMGGEIVSQNAIAPDARTDMPAIAAGVCPVSLELMDEGNAMIGGTLLAPCLPDQDVVIAHAGMVFTAKTLATGALFFSLPALKTEGQIDVRFTSGETASAALAMPDAASVARVAVQWPYLDGFAVHAFEGGAGFDDAGHIWQENPNTPTAGAAQTGGYLTQLGDPSVEMPLMAQVFTYDGTAQTDVVFEVHVTDTNCASEVMGDVIYAKAGVTEKSELTIAMPECDAVGEFVQMGFSPPDAALAMVN